MKKCEACSKTIILSEWIRFESEQGERVFFCEKCYKKLPKEEKIKLTKCKAQAKMTLTGGEAVGGAIGGLAGAAGVTGWNAGIKRSMKKQRKKYGLKEEEIDAVSIKLFNKHFALCESAKEHEAVTKALIDEKDKKLS